MGSENEADMGSELAFTDRWNVSTLPSRRLLSSSGAECEEFAGKTCRRFVKAESEKNLHRNVY